MRILPIFTFVSLVVLSTITYSQQAVVSLPSSFTATPGELIQIPLTTTGFDTICNISLVFIYDTNVLTYQGYTGTFTLSSDHSLNRYKNSIRFGWYSLATPLSLIDNDTLITVNFIYQGGSSSLNWDLSQGSCLIGNCNAGILPSNWVNGSVIPQPTGEISGTLVYDNSSQTPLSQVSVILKNSSDISIDTSFTDDQGNYSFQVNSTGNYNLSLSPLQLWNGVNSIDALLIVHHFVGMAPLSGLALKAADVNNNHYVNTSDALNVLKRYVGLQDSFQSGDWAFDNLSVTMDTLTHQTLNIKALFMGDVNQSWQP